MTLAKKPPVRLLTVLLAKEGAIEDELIENADKCRKTSIRIGGRIIGTLYSRASRRHHPTWVGFFGESIDPSELGLWSSSSSAALVVPCSGRLLAVTFGYGRHLVNPQHIQSNFGLRISLACIGDGAIRTIDRKTFEGLTTHIREQASKETALSDFGLNIERDLLRAVVGTPTDSQYGLKLAGMDALSATCRTTLDGLPALLKAYIAKAKDDTYKLRYPWIDNISEVKDRATIESLEEALASELRVRNFANKWLAVPDMMEWSDVGGFRYTERETAELFEDIHLATYTDQVRSLDTLTADRMRSQRVAAFSASTGSVCNRWSLFNCLYAEIDRADGTYLLNNGNWYRIDIDFVRKIDEVIDGIQGTTLPLPSFEKAEDEDAYNKRLAKTLGDACVMDRKNVSYGGGKSSVEFCDVFTSSRKMIHVKRYRGSTVLSHLFAQGSVSATAFLSDAEFRRTLNGKLPAALRLTNPLQRPQARHYEIVYVVVSRSAGKLRLPFFSRVTLRNAVRQLEAFGFRVSLTKVSLA